MAPIIIMNDFLHKQFMMLCQHTFYWSETKTMTLQTDSLKNAIHYRFQCQRASSFSSRELTHRKHLLHHSHSNTRSEPQLQSTPQLMEHTVVQRDQIFSRWNTLHLFDYLQVKNNKKLEKRNLVSMSIQKILGNEVNCFCYSLASTWTLAHALEIYKHTDSWVI